MLFFFSGNGNSRLVADAIAASLGETMAPLMQLRRGAVDIPVADERIVWVMPVHCWGLPVAVASLMRELDPHTFSKSALHYLVLTCGDDCGKAADSWRRILSLKGWTPQCAFSVQMPNTYVLLPGFNVDPPEVAAKKLAAMLARVELIASKISSQCVADDVVEGALPRIKSAVYPLFARFDIRPSLFRVDADACIHCRKCEKACPLGNISFSPDLLPLWGDDCTQCLGCYNVCPSHAIAYGRRTKGKGQYYAKKCL